MSLDLTRLRAAKASGQEIGQAKAAKGSAFTLRAAYPIDTALRDRDVRAFTALRSIHADSFFDTARPSEEAVRGWVEQCYDADDCQINFVAEDRSGAILMFMGLSEIDPGTGRAEFGRLMRAEGAPRGIALCALLLLLDWARGVGLNLIYLEVFADNDRARRLYERAGFRLDQEFRRRPVADKGRIVWDRGCGEGDRPVLAMILDLTAREEEAEA